MGQESPLRGLRHIFRADHTFSLTIGVTDGILTALTLVSGRLLTGKPPTVELALKISVASALTSIFVFCTAEYARLRGQLMHAERELNLTSHGRLAASHLGRAIRRETMASAAISSLANFVGAFFPVLIGAFFPRPPGLAVAVAVAALALLGGALAYSIHGNLLGWALALAISGVLLALVGAKLDVL
jgi:predicted membrane protein (TIGR00267 family)